MRSLAQVVVATSLVTGALAQPTVPVLRYQPPPNFYRSAITPPEDYSSTQFNASVQFYPFRPFNGNIEQMFQRTLLREWIDPRYQETIVAGQPEFKRIAIQGAQAAFTVSFFENVVGIPKPHLRMLIVAGNAAAIVDASANNTTTWARAIPILNQMSTTLRVESESATPAVQVPIAGGQSISGQYMGFKQKYTVNLNGPVGSGTFIRALHYYLFSADGRVYRAYDQISAPGGNLARFDFEAARRADPVNSGRYTISGNQLRLQLGVQPVENITAPLPRDGHVTIERVEYTRQ